MISLKILFKNTSIGEVEIDRAQVQKYMGDVPWQTMSPEKIASFLIRNIYPWRVESMYIPKSSLDLPNVAMPKIYFLSLASSSMNGNELVLTFNGPNIEIWDVFEKNEVTDDWDYLQTCTADFGEVLYEYVDKIPASQNYTSCQWLDKFFIGEEMPYQEMTNERMKAVWDIILWANAPYKCDTINDKTATALSKFYGFCDDGAECLEDNLRAIFN